MIRLIDEKRLKNTATTEEREFFVTFLNPNWKTLKEKWTYQWRVRDRRRKGKRNDQS